VKRGAFAAATRNDEGAKWLELALAFVNRVLQLADSFLVNARLGEVIVHFLEIRRCQEGADRKEIALDRHEDFIDARQWLDGACHPEEGVELIDIAVGFHAGVVLLDAAAAEEARVAGVAGLRVNLHGRKSTVIRASETALNTTGQGLSAGRLVAPG
jgi:hypothetical protein